MSNKPLDYLEAKLEELHSDVKEIHGYVDELRADHHGRKAINKFVFGVLGVLGAIVGWLIDNMLTMAKQINFG